MVAMYVMLLNKAITMHMKPRLPWHWIAFVELDECYNIGNPVTSTFRLPISEYSQCCFLFAKALVAVQLRHDLFGRRFPK